jgi:hypothetical protein
MRPPLLYYICLFIHVATAIVGGFRYKSLPRPLRILEWMIVLGVIDEGLQYTLALSGIRTLWMSHFFTLIEFICVVSIYSYWINYDRKKMFLFLCLAVFSLLWSASKFTFEPISYSDDWTSTLSKVLQIAFSAYLLIEILKESDLRWANDPRLWVVAGVLIYAAGTLFWFALFNKMLEISPDLLRKSYSLNWFLMITSNVFFLIGFLCRK